MRATLRLAGINALFLALFLCPALAPVIWASLGEFVAKIDVEKTTNLKDSQHQPRYQMVEIAAFAIRIAYYQIPLRNIIQYNQNCFLPSRLLVYVPIPNTSCLQSNLEYSVTVSFGSLGQRLNRKNINLDKSATSNRTVIVLGDSHAMGWGVSDDAVFSSRLNKMGYRVINLAVSSYGTAREFLRLREWSKAHQRMFYDADAIVIQYCDNDLDENISFMRSGSQFHKDSEIASENHFKLQKDSNPYHLKNDTTLLMLIKANPGIILNIVRETYHGSFVLAKDSLRNLLLKTPFKEGLINQGLITLQSDKHASAFWSILQQNSDLLSDKKVLIYISNGHGSNNQRLTGEIDRYLQTSKVMNPSKFQVLYPRDTGLRPETDSYYLVDDHPNALGHLRLANYLAETLK